MTLAVSGNNGTAPSSALAALPGRNGDGSTHTAPHVTAASYARVRAAMSSAGLGDLQPSDGWSCYRDRAAQQHMRDIGLTTVPVGQSIHGEWSYGSAVDFANLGGFGAPRHEWLRVHGAGHGWYQPYWAGAGGTLPEPWHWEYDTRNDAHAGEDDDMSFTDADRNTIQHTAALLEETPYRSAQQVMAWQVSRVPGAPSTFLQDQTDGVTNTYTLLSVDPSSRTWTPRALLSLMLAVALVVLALLLPALVPLGEAALPYLGIMAAIGGVLAGLTVGGHRTRVVVYPAPPPPQPAPGQETGD